MGKVIFIVFASLNPAEKKSAESYMKEVGLMQKEAGAITLGRHPVAEVFLGNLKADVVAIVEFPDQQAFDQVFESAEYEKLIPLREKGFSTLNAFVSKSN